jgi:predicted RNA methylase
MMAEVISLKADYVYGIEILPNLIKEAVRARAKDNIEFICADATLYDFSNCRSIDCITMSNVLEHIEYRTSFLNKLIQKVKWKDQNNKKLLIRVPMIDREWLAIYKKELGVEYRLDPTHFTEYTFDQFKEEMDQCNIEIKSFNVVFGEIYAICRAL